MRNKLIFFFIFLLLIHAYSYPLSSNNKASYQRPSFNIIIKKNGVDSENKLRYSFQCRIKNKFFNNRIISLYLEGTLKKNDQATIIDIHTGNISLNPTHIQDFSFYAVYKNNVLTVTYLKTKELILWGGINFSGLPRVNLTLDIKGLSLKELNRLWDIEDFPFQGDFRGKISITGKTDAPLIRGTLQAYQGNLEDYKFQEVLLNFRGNYPWIQFFDSFIVIENTNLDVEGAVNLSKLYHLPYGDGKMQAEKLQFNKLDSSRNSNKKEESSLKGFLSLSQKSTALLYKLGTNSYLKLTVKEDAPTSLIKRKMEF